MCDTPLRNSLALQVFYAQQNLIFIPFTNNSNKKEKKTFWKMVSNNWFRMYLWQHQSALKNVLAALPYPFRPFYKKNKNFVPLEIVSIEIALFIPKALSGHFCRITLVYSARPTCTAHLYYLISRERHPRGSGTTALCHSAEQTCVRECGGRLQRTGTMTSTRVCVRPPCSRTQAHSAPWTQ